MNLAARAAAWCAHPVAIILLPGVCIAYSALGGPSLPLNLFLSLISITITQLILYVSSKRDDALHKKIDELVKAVPDADNTFIGIEKIEVTSKP